MCIIYLCSIVLFGLMTTRLNKYYNIIQCIRSHLHIHIIHTYIYVYTHVIATHVLRTQNSI